MNEVGEQLAEIPLFRDLDSNQLRRLERLAVRRSFGDGTEILQEGGEAAVFLAITEGYVDVTRAGTHVATLGPGACVGEAALSDHRRRSATVRASGPVRAFAWAGWSFMAEVRASAVLGSRLMGVMAGRVRAADEALVDRATVGQLFGRLPWLLR